MASQVYFTDFRALPGTSVPEKLALIAPRLTCIPADGAILDGAFSDPIAAFEAGYRWGKEGL